MAEDGFEIEYDENWSSLSQRLSAFGENVAKKVTTSALKESAAYMKHEAILYASLSTEPHLLKVDGAYVTITPGNLKRKIRYGKVRKSPPGEIAYRVYVAIKMAWYAKFIEFGTSEMAASPFMRPAFEHNFMNVARIFKEMIDIEISAGGFE